ncbi:hypothetical protein CBER1_03108 [Cercospora berteroae]|uniref:SGNH hydrolase-type esterase domain-containing protein n=1 Tax=Cercospora berteroae TaxID=357750 RepID=A0A2S6CK40_9PEZI|nr:hypothetical protein CBER1_03108 [Cercospora berteroae]
MKFLTLTHISAFSLSLTAASPTSQSARAEKPPFFLLAGDSTTAKQSTGGGGWGAGFLNKTLKTPASGLNYGHNGATTVSFRDGGDWDTVLSQATSHIDDYKVFVTIQFGHNDQKADKGISIDDYKTNIGAFIDEVREVGAEPILVTPLTRRGFSGTPPRIVENLAAERNATIDIAKAKSSKYIDLNLASTTYCNAIGPEASWQYNLINATIDGDRTHLNDYGSVVFGRLVSDLLVDKYGKQFKEWTVKNQTLSALLAKGIAA